MDITDDVGTPQEDQSYALRLPELQQASLLRIPNGVGNLSSGREPIGIQDVASIMKALPDEGAMDLAREAGEHISFASDVLNQASLEITEEIESRDLWAKRGIPPDKAEEEHKTVKELAKKGKENRDTKQEGQNFVRGRWKGEGEEMLDRLKALPGFHDTGTTWKHVRKAANASLNYQEMGCRVFSEIYTRLTASKGQGVDSKVLVKGMDFWRAGNNKNDLKDCVTTEQIKSIPGLEAIAQAYGLDLNLLPSSTPPVSLLEGGEPGEHEEDLSRMPTPSTSQDPPAETPPTVVGMAEDEVLGHETDLPANSAKPDDHLPSPSRQPDNRLQGAKAREMERAEEIKRVERDACQKEKDEAKEKKRAEREAREKERDEAKEKRRAEKEAREKERAEEKRLEKEKTDREKDESGAREDEDAELAPESRKNAFGGPTIHYIEHEDGETWAYLHRRSGWKTRALEEATGDEMSVPESFQPPDTDSGRSEDSLELELPVDPRDLAPPRYMNPAKRSFYVDSLVSSYTYWDLRERYNFGVRSSPAIGDAVTILEDQGGDSEEQDEMDRKAAEARTREWEACRVLQQATLPKSMKTPKKRMSGAEEEEDLERLMNRAESQIQEIPGALPDNIVIQTALDETEAVREKTQDAERTEQRNEQVAEAVQALDHHSFEEVRRMWTAQPDNEVYMALHTAKLDQLKSLVRNNQKGVLPVFEDEEIESWFYGDYDVVQLQRIHEQNIGNRVVFRVLTRKRNAAISCPEDEPYTAEMLAAAGIRSLALLSYYYPENAAIGVALQAKLSSVEGRPRETWSRDEQAAVFWSATPEKLQSLYDDDPNDYLLEQTARDRSVALVRTEESSESDPARQDNVTLEPEHRFPQEQQLTNLGTLVPSFSQQQPVERPATRFNDKKRPASSTFEQLEKDDFDKSFDEFTTCVLEESGIQDPPPKRKRLLRQIIDLTQEDASIVVTSLFEEDIKAYRNALEGPARNHLESYLVAEFHKTEVELERRKHEFGQARRRGPTPGAGD